MKSNSKMVMLTITKIHLQTARKCVWDPSYTVDYLIGVIMLSIGSQYLLCVMMYYALQDHILMVMGLVVLAEVYVL